MRYILIIFLLGLFLPAWAQTPKVIPFNTKFAGYIQVESLKDKAAVNSVMGYVLVDTTTGQLYVVETNDMPLDTGVVTSTGSGEYIYRELSVTDKLTVLNDQIDIKWGGIGLLIGADNNLATRTNSTNKNAIIAVPHYTNSEEPVGLFFQNTSTDNIINIGGGSSNINSATEINFYTSSNNTTTSGSVAGRFKSNRQLVLSSGTDINEFSVDGTFADNSDDAVPTEKAVKTYVDNAVKTEVITLDSTTIKTLNSSPFTLISAPGVGKIVHVMSAQVYLDAGTTQFNPSGILELYYNVSEAEIYESNMGGYGGTSDKMGMFIPVISTASNGNNKPLILKATNDCTTGNGSLKIIITYKIVTL